jgi:long-chain fatty acid transport protein
VALVAMTACLGGSAMASSFDVFGVGARGAAMGSAAVATADDYSAVYYNPANLTLRASTLGLGFMMSFDRAQIRLAERPPGYDIPNLGANTPALPTMFEQRERRDLEGLDTLAGFVIGATTNLGLERFRVGVVAFVPIGNSAAESRFADERERLFSNRLEFDLLGDRIQHSSVFIAAAYQILDWLSLGAGLSFMPGAPTDNFVYVPNLTDQGTVDLNVRIDIESRFRPNVGVLVHPEEDGFRIGIAFRDAQLFRIVGQTEVQVRGLQDQDDHPFFQTLDITLQYSPRQLVFGVSQPFGNLLVALDTTLSLWSDFIGAHGDDAGFSDTLSPRLGLELALSETDLLRFGAVFEPSPVPAQSGRTNYVDNDRLVGSFGSAHRVRVLGSTLSVGWYFQLHFLLESTQVKTAVPNPPVCAEGVTVVCDELPDGSVDPATGLVWAESFGLQTGNPGFPGYSSGGWLGAAGVEVSWEF